MIIFGVKVTPLKSVPLTKEFCPNCNAENSLVLSVFSMHIVFFGLPIVPVDKNGVTICIRCNQTFEKKEMPNFLRLHYNQVAATTRTPLWTWSGLGIIIVLIGVLIICF